MIIRIKYTLDSPTAMTPLRNGKSSGYDLYASESLSVQPGQTAKCPIGVAFEVPEGYEGQIRGRSGNSLRGFKVDIGTIDSDFRQAVSAILYNSTRELWRVKAGDRIAQIVFVRVHELADELRMSHRPTSSVSWCASEKSATRSEIYPATSEDGLCKGVMIEQAGCRRDEP